MQVKFEQLQSQLSKGLAPIYFLSGDEPLLQQEAADAIRSAARKAGYEEREIFHADNSFDWNELMQEACSMGLFSQLKILDLRIPSGKPGKAGTAALKEYCENIPQDNLLIIQCGKLDGSAKKSAWVKALDQAGVVVYLWPVERQRLPGWIDNRMRSRNITAPREAIQIIADRVEGNLLAAAQEVEKLLLLYGEGSLTVEQVNTSVADSARFDVFGLVDAALQGNVKRVERMMFGLETEGVEAILVLWALAREIRTIVQVATEMQNGRPLGAALDNARVWSNRKQIVGNAVKKYPPKKWSEILQKCSDIDLTIKGQSDGKAWHKLHELGVAMAGVSI